MKFSSGKTPDRGPDCPDGYPITIYDTVFNLLFGDARQGVEQGIVQRLAEAGKTRYNVEQQELQAALVATMSEFSWGEEFIPGVVGHFSNNNRSLYVFQTIKKVFPKTTMMIPYKRTWNGQLSGVHRESKIRDSDRMAVQFPGFRKQQGDERADRIMAVFKQDQQTSRWRLNTKAFLGQVKEKMTELLDEDATNKFFVESQDSTDTSSQESTGSRFGNYKSTGRSAWFD